MNESRGEDQAIDALLRRQFEGPVRDEGFSARLMQRLPRRRRHVAWPSWLGVLVGVASCWLALLPSSLLRAGWRDWMAGQWSAADIAMLSAVAVMALLALAWGVAEAQDR